VYLNSRSISAFWREVENVYGKAPAIGVKPPGSLHAMSCEENAGGAAATYTTELAAGEVEAGRTCWLALARQEQGRTVSLFAGDTAIQAEEGGWIEEQERKKRTVSLFSGNAGIQAEGEAASQSRHTHTVLLMSLQASAVLLRSPPDSALAEDKLTDIYLMKARMRELQEEVEVLEAEIEAAGDHYDRLEHWT
jgi:hypothetical protein